MDLTERTQRARIVGSVLARTLAVLTLAACAVPVAAATAGAQEECDPAYGCDPDPTPFGQVTCSMNVSSATPGQTVTVTVAGAQAGAAIQITLDGNPVASGTADAGGSATIPFTFAPTNSATTHTVFAVGSGFSANCGTITNTAVLPETQTQTTPTSSGTNGATTATTATTTSSSVSGGSLAVTGVAIGLLLAVALVAILVGQRLVASARRMRRRKARQRNDLSVLRERPPDSLRV